MKFGVFSVYDDKAKAYVTPFFLPTDAMAVREFTNAANDPAHKFHQNPEDYTLFKIGAWDSDSGAFFESSIATVMVRALQVKKISIDPITGVKQ